MFGPWASVSATGAGPYDARRLVLSNRGTHAAVDLAIVFEGASGIVELLAGPLPARLEAGASVVLPLRRVRRDAVFRVTVRWTAEGGQGSAFFGVLTAGN